MRRISLERRRVVALAASGAALSGCGPLIFQLHRHMWLGWALIGVVLSMLVTSLVLLVRLKRDEARR